MNNPARFLTLEILNRIETKDAYADILIEAAYRKNLLNDSDKRLLMELVNGVLRRRNTLDYVISLFSSVKPSKMQRDVLNILRLGAYQIMFLDRIPVSAAVNESVKLAKGIGQRQGNFVNAVLRAIDRGRDGINYPDISKNPIEHISIKYSHPEWLVRRFVNDLGVDEALQLCRADNEPPPLTIRINPGIISREDLLLRLAEAGYDARFTSFSLHGLTLKGAGDIANIPGFAEGLFTVQDEASQLVSFILGPCPGEKVLDACAAPGGKTTHMAEMMADTGEVFALDIRQQGVRKIEDNARRLGLKSVRAIKSDASKPLDFEEGTFDKILLDAPCSGSGVMRRHPEGKWQKKEEDIAELTARQNALIENVSRYLKPGGVLVYSVCSVMKEEGEDVINAFLKSHREYLIEPATPVIGEVGRSLICEGGFFRVYSHRQGMDGFFAARLRRM